MFSALLILQVVLGLSIIGLVLLQQGDEVLDYRDAAAYYRDKDLVVSAGGNHRFDNLDDHLPRIDAWLADHGVR